MPRAALACARAAASSWRLPQPGLGLGEPLGGEPARAAEQALDLELVRPRRRVARAQPAAVPRVGDRQRGARRDDVEQRVEVGAAGRVRRAVGDGGGRGRRGRAERQREIVGHHDRGRPRRGLEHRRRGGARVERGRRRAGGVDRHADRESVGRGGGGGGRVGVGGGGRLPGCVPGVSSPSPCAGAAGTGCSSSGVSTWMIAPSSASASTAWRPS